jgi:6-phosphogluconate dehydrogenase
MPGELTALHAPSERPNEPITHGVGVGAGAGPEILPSGTEMQYQSAHDLLKNLAATSNNPSVNSLLAYLGGGL